MTNSKKSELERLVELLTKTLNDSKSQVNHVNPQTLEGEAKRAFDEYKAMSESLMGFPNKQSDTEIDPRWKLPPLSPQADT